LDLQLPKQSVPITTKVVDSNPAPGGEATIHKSLHRKLKTRKQESHYKQWGGVNPGAPEGEASPALHLAPVVLQTR